MSDKDVLNNNNLNDLRVWLEDNKGQMPEEIGSLLGKLLRVYAEFAKSRSRAKQTLTLLRQAMGILPKSEKGTAEAELPGFEQLTEEQQQELLSLRKKSDTLAQERAGYQRKIRSLLPKPKNPMQLELTAAAEPVFTSPASARDDKDLDEPVERQVEFGRKSGLHSTHEAVKRVDLNILVTETTHNVETVTDFSTGKSVRASMDHVGPPGFQLTWRAIANLVKLHVGFAIPINRLAMLIGQPEFTSGKICRILKFAATLFLPIYLCLLESLSDVDLLSGDDTKTKVIELEEEPKSDDEISAQIDSLLGFKSERADGKGDKKALNVSLLIGRPVKNDPRSTIRFFRTHMGSVGNLLTKTLEGRSPKAGALTFQGDLSSTNLPELGLRQRFALRIAGCGAHARRPFWRYREDDVGLCYWMLNRFFPEQAC